MAPEHLPSQLGGERRHLSQICCAATREKNHDYRQTVEVADGQSAATDGPTAAAIDQLFQQTATQPQKQTAQQQ